MYNIFSSLSIDTLIALSTNTSTQKEISAIIYKYIPLEIYDSDPNSLFTIPYSPESLSKKIKTLSIDKIADFTLEICKFYWQLPPVRESTTDLMINPDKEYANFINTQKRLNQFLYNEHDYSLFEELKHFMISSYFYLNTHTKEIKSDCITKKSMNYFITGDDHYNIETNGISRYLYNRLRLFQKKAAPFINNFFSNPTITLDPKDPSKILHQTTHIRSIYDVELLSKIIETSKPRWNPFILDDELSPDLSAFLKRCSDMYLDEKISSGTATRISNEFPSYSKPSFKIYNNFLLERLSCANFINSLYNLSASQHPYISENTFNLLKDFMQSPLLNFRLRILDFHKTTFAENLGNRPEFIGAWNFHLQSILKKQLLCTLPILELVFHYLMSLRQKNVPLDIQHENTTYFSKIVNKKNYLYFHLPSDKEIITPIRYDFPEDAKKQPYKDFTKKLFFDFFQNTEQSALNNLLSTNSLQQLNKTHTDLFINTIINADSKLSIY